MSLNLKNAIAKTKEKIPLTTQSTWFLRTLGLYKIPILAFVWPKVIELNDHRSELKIPLCYRTQNHLNVMYFGALCVGAEAVVATHVVHEINKTGQRIDFLFKDFKAEFLKRAEADVHFVCDVGEAVRALVQKAANSTERCTETFQSYAITPSKTGDEKVAIFNITLSVKNRSKKA